MRRGSRACVRRRRAASTDLMPAPYVPIDDTALEAVGVGRQPARAVRPRRADVAATCSARRRSTGRSRRSSTRPTTPPSTACAAMLITRVAVRDAALTPVDAPVHARPGIQPRHGRTAAPRPCPPHPSSSDCSTGDDPARAQGGQRVIAALAEVAYETPAIERGLLLAPDARWTPDLDDDGHARRRAARLPARAAGHARRPALAHLDRTLARRRRDASPPAVDSAADSGEPHRVQLRPSKNSRIRVGRRPHRSGRGRRRSRRHDLALSTAITPERAQAELARIDDSVRAFTGAVTVDAKRVTLTSQQRVDPAELQEQGHAARGR